MIATSNQVKRFSVFLNPVIELYAPQIRDVIRCDTTRNGTFFFAPKGPRGTFPVTLFPLQEPTTDDGLANLYAKQVLKPASPYAIAELCRKYGEKIPVPLGSFWVTRNRFVKMLVTFTDRGLYGEAGVDEKPWPPGIWFAGVPLRQQ